MIINVIIYRPIGSESVNQLSAEAKMNHTFILSQSECHL